jgi:shikimate kinase
LIGALSRALPSLQPEVGRMTVVVCERLPASKDCPIHFVGPGGVGKSTVGKLVSQALGWPFLDLDMEFIGRIAPIDHFIRAHGYERYQEANSALAHDVLRQNDQPRVAALSSGFLMIHRGPEYGRRNRLLVQQTGYSILILPSADIDEATDIVVARQLARGFGLTADRERAKFRCRFSAYLELGDMQIFSTAAPEEIAGAIADRFRRLSADYA